MGLPHAEFASTEITVGADFTRVVVVDPPDDGTLTEGELATLLIGATVTADLIDTDEDQTVILALTGALDSAANRKISFAATDTQTADLTPGTYLWRVTVTLSTGSVIAIRPLGLANVRAA